MDMEKALASMNKKLASIIKSQAKTETSIKVLEAVTKERNEHDRLAMCDIKLEQKELNRKIWKSPAVLAGAMAIIMAIKEFITR